MSKARLRLNKIIPICAYNGQKISIEMMINSTIIIKFGFYTVIESIVKISGIGEDPPHVEQNRNKNVHIIYYFFLNEINYGTNKNYDWPS